MKRLIQEIHRRSLWQVLGIYLAGSWVALQVVEQLTNAAGLPEWVQPLALVLLVVGFPVVMATAFVQEGISGRGLEKPRELPAEDGGIGGAGEASPPAAVSVQTPGAHHRIFTWRNSLLVGVVAFSLMFGVAGLVVLLSSPQSPLGPSTGMAEEAAPAIAVLPFDISGTEHPEWREDMVYLLSTNLDAAGELRAIDSRTVLARWDREVGVGERADLETALRVARATGARHALVGSAVASGPRVRLSADIYALDTGALLDQVQIEGSPDSIFSLVDRLSIEVLRSVLPDLEGAVGIGLARLTTESPAALKAFLEGESRYTRSEWAAAIPAYEEAVALDSTFALAHYRLSLSYGWAFDDGERDDHHVDAVRYAERLPERERLLVRANLAYMMGLPYEALGYLERSTRRYPDDPEAWYLYGETLLHLGEQVLRDPLRESRSAFLRTVELDPDFSAAHHHLVDYGFAMVDSAEVAWRMIEYARTGSEEYIRAFRAASALAFGSEEERARALAAADDLSGLAIYITMYEIAHPTLLDTQEPLLLRVMGREDSDARVARSIALWSLLSQARGAELLSVLAGATPEEQAVHLYVARAWGLDVPEEALDRALEESGPGGLGSLLFAARAVDRGEWEEHAEVVDGARSAADALEASPDLADQMRGRWLAGVVAALEAYALWHRGDPESALERFREAERTATGWGPNHRLGGPRALNTLIRFWIGQLLLEMERPREAEPYLLSLSQTLWMDWAPALERLGQLYDRRGDSDKAAEYYARFVELWAEADEELQPRVQAAQARLEEILAERG